MKRTLLNPLLSTLLTAALLGLVAPGWAQTLTTSWTNTFDTASGSQNSNTSWNYWYDMYQQAYGSNYGFGPVTLDMTMNSTNGPAPTSGPSSGSLLFVSPWPGVRENTGKGGQNVIYGTFDGGGQYNTGTTIDGSKYDSLSFDLYADPASPLNSAGHVCSLSAGFFNNNYSTYTITNIPIGTNNFGKWIRYVCTINKASVPQPGDNGTNAAFLPAGPMFNINCYGGENVSLFTNTTPTRLWIDNIYLKMSTAQAPPPTLIAPQLNLNPGLNIFAENVFNDQYQRNEIQLVQNSGVGWLGQQGVTYQFAIKDFPTIVSNSFQAHLFITENGGVDTAPSLDYNDTNLVWLNVQANNNGTGTAYLRYKVHEQSANTNVFGPPFVGTNYQTLLPQYAGTAVALGAPTVIGTWGMTFNDDTNITIFGPGGVSTNFSMDDAILSNFVEPLNIVLGAQPNNTNIIYNGQAVVYAEAIFTNAGASSSIIDDNFLADTSLDMTLWRILQNEPNTVQLFPNDPNQILVSWNLPDTGFGLQTVGHLGGPSPLAWVTLTGPDAANSSLPVPPTVISLTPGLRTVLVPSADLQNTNSSFFRLDGQSFTKLQVLMPGETAAPGTPTGKTGTPTAQTVGSTFQITVNAVDANWTVMTGVTDTVHLTSSDTAATLDPDAALVGGTWTFNATFNTAGTWTVTASDVTDNTKASGTGSPTAAH